jgi:hypothetical protein
MKRRKTKMQDKQNENNDAEIMNDPVSASCADRVCGARDSRLADLERFNLGEFDAEDNPDGFDPEEHGEPNEYGLSLDFVEAGTFDGQRRGYVRYQFSWGGPSEELRIYADGEIEFWFMDWGDGASRTLDRHESAIVEQFLHLDGYTSIDAWARDFLRDYRFESEVAWIAWGVLVQMGRRLPRRDTHPLIISGNGAG